MDIDWVTLNSFRDNNERRRYVEDVIKQCTPDNPIYLGNIIPRATKDGVYVTIALGAQEQSGMRGGQDNRMKWKIQFGGKINGKEMRGDEWGSNPMPGDKIVRLIPKSLVRGFGEERCLVPSGERNAAIMDGTYEEKFMDRIEYTVDKKGCCEMPFSDAMYYLSNYGIHGKSGRALCGKPQTSRDPCESPERDKDGNPKMKLIWYHRCAELDRDDYAAARNRKKPRKEKAVQEPKVDQEPGPTDDNGSDIQA